MPACPALRAAQYTGSVLEGSALTAPAQGEEVMFYTHVLCPFAERVWLCLLEKHVDHALVHIDLSSKPGWFYSLNSRGLVPCVAHKDDIVIESADICECVPSLQAVAW
jgi:hypothetical protein